MAITPAELDGISADLIHAFELQVWSDRVGLDDSLSGPLVTTARAGALCAEIPVREPMNTRSRPGDFENLLGLNRADVAGRIDHSRASRQPGNVWGDAIMNDHINSSEPFHDSPGEHDHRFLVVAPSINAVRRALFRAPGGAEVIGRHDRQTIECRHTMNEHSLGRHWPVIVSRLEKAGLKVVEGPASSP
jgi:hypothetical protein